jgi:hypothetical protein
MCQPNETDQKPSPGGPSSRSIVGMGGAMMLACLAGPALAGAIGGLGVGVLLGAGGALLAVVLCASAPLVFVGLRRRSTNRRARRGL